MVLTLVILQTASPVPRREDRLDLMDLEDIKAWWDLRRYIQIDFLDESAMMDYCGSTVFCRTLFSGSYSPQQKTTSSHIRNNLEVQKGSEVSQGGVLTIMLIVCFMTLGKRREDSP